METKWEAIAIVLTAFITFLIGMKCKSKCGCCGLQCEFVREDLTNEERQRHGKLQHVVIKRALSSEASERRFNVEKSNGDDQNAQERSVVRHL